MRANNLAQTSTTTGTGNMTLSATGWNGCATMFSFFGAGHAFEYTIRNSNGEYEKGLGTTPDATTLVRNKVISNHLGTVCVSDIKEILAYLKNKGCTHVVYARKSRIKTMRLDHVESIK